jgi:hypothetical protein
MVEFNLAKTSSIDGLINSHFAKSVNLNNISDLESILEN